MKNVAFWIDSGRTTPQIWTADENVLLSQITYLNTTAVLSLEPTLTWSQFVAEVSVGVVTEVLRFFLFNPSGTPASQLSGLLFEFTKGTEFTLSSAGVGGLGLVQLEFITQRS